LRRHLLDEPTFDSEWRVWNKLVDKHRVVLTPGATCHAPQPGFFRMCYAWVPVEALPAAVARIVSLRQPNGKA
jgi:aspartate/methionine/tyrosine aminotransferase